MKRGTFKIIGSVCCLSMLMAATNAWGCGQGASTITVLPTLGGSAFEVDAMNAAGQLTGFSYTTGNTAAHAFLYSGGALKDLGTLGGNISQGFGINASGQVVGSAGISGDTETHAFLFNGTNMVDLGTLGGSFSSASAVNDSGETVGSSLTAGDSAQEAFLYANGSITNLGDLGGGFSTAVAINQAGAIAGDSYTVTFGYHAFLYTNGTMADLGSLGGDYSSVSALNNNGVVVGESSVTNGDTHAFIYTGGQMADISTFGGTYSTAYAVNDAGQVTGVANTANDAQTHGFFYAGGSLTDLGTLGGNYSSPSAINNLGQVVGDSATTNGDSHAFLWQNGTMADLNTFLPANSGWELLTALFINDSGRVVGTGAYNGVSQWYVMDVSSSANNPPVALAGPNQTVTCPALVVLDGSRSSDPDGDALSYQWSEGGAVFSTNSTLTASFDLGVHVITLQVTDPCGASAQTNVLITVTDTVPPSVSCPNAINASSDANCQALVPDLISQTVATDNCTPANAIVITQDPPAGTQMGLGQHTITVTATDASGNHASCATLFTVTDTTAPVIASGPSPVTISADSNCQGAVPQVTSQIVATDNCTPANALLITQDPPAGALVGVGQHTIVVTVTDASGNHTAGSTSFSVADTTAPTILSTPAPITNSVDSNCQAAAPNVVPSVVAADNCTPANQLVITQVPAAGTPLGLGQHAITITVTDASGNATNASVSFTVVDSTAPTILSTPAPITASVDSNCQAAVPNVVPNVAATDNCTPANQLVITQSPAAGTSLGLGQHSIVVTVTDASGNASTANVSFTVADTTAPTILSAPAPITVSVDSNCQAAVPNVLSSVVATDNCTPANQLVMTQSPAAGTLLARGQYLVTVTVTDASGNTSTANVSLAIADTTPPTINSLSVTPNVLSPPNHQLVPVTVSVTASDNCDAAPVSQIISITSSEPPTSGDIQITGALTATLAATRTPSGPGRIYTITVRCTDASGNSSTGTVTVTVPKGSK